MESLYVKLKSLAAWADFFWKAPWEVTRERWQIAKLNKGRLVCVDPIQAGVELGKYQDGGWGMGRGALLQRGEANTILPTLTK